jgi:hypothetical protein
MCSIKKKHKKATNRRDTVITMRQMNAVVDVWLGLCVCLFVSVIMYVCMFVCFSDHVCLYVCLFQWPSRCLFVSVCVRLLTPLKAEPVIEEQKVFVVKLVKCHTVVLGSLLPHSQPRRRTAVTVDTRHAASDEVKRRGYIVSECSNCEWQRIVK